MKRPLATLLALTGAALPESLLPENYVAARFTHRDIEALRKAAAKRERRRKRDEKNRGDV